MRHQEEYYLCYCELRFDWGLIAGSSTVSEMVGSACQFSEDCREVLDDADCPETSPSSRYQAIKDGLKHAIIDASDIEVSFESFPYYLRYFAVHFWFQHTRYVIQHTSTYFS